MDTANAAILCVVRGNDKGKTMNMIEQAALQSVTEELINEFECTGTIHHGTRTKARQIMTAIKNSEQDFCQQHCPWTHHHPDCPKGDQAARQSGGGEAVGQICDDGNGAYVELYDDYSFKIGQPVYAHLPKPESAGVPEAGSPDMNEAAWRFIEALPEGAFRSEALNSPPNNPQGAHTEIGVG